MNSTPAKKRERKREKERRKPHLYRSLPANKCRRKNVKTLFCKCQCKNRFRQGFQWMLKPLEKVTENIKSKIF